MDCWISQQITVPCFANRKRWLRSPRQWAVFLPYARVKKWRHDCCLSCPRKCGSSSSSCLAPCAASHSITSQGTLILIILVAGIVLFEIKGRSLCLQTHRDIHDWQTYTGSLEYAKTWFYNPMDQDSSVGIATRYGLDGPVIEFRWGRDFPYRSRPALGPTQSPVQLVPGLSRG